MSRWVLKGKHKEIIMKTVDIKKPVEIDEDCQFMADLVTIDNGNRNYNLGLWNLALSLRDLKLYCKGIKPHRRWKISDVKWYFGMNGNAEILATKLDKLYTILH